eukprot:GHVU01133139.1.p1 GENE.GHVU01133139.1~~GHVU01133139.1.p1  ORF type:complete len:196 (+),score=24.75 GHVU01133139.1:33-590(+)
MNPEYGGRSDLPDNLKARFRSAAMMIPDYTLISEVILLSLGFEKAESLARKVVMAFRLCSEQLSVQSHYDYGMRALRTVLAVAGRLKRTYVEEDESGIMLAAINEVNLAKLVADDAKIFNDMIADLFPEVIEYAPPVAVRCLNAATESNTACNEMMKQRLLRPYAPSGSLPRRNYSVLLKPRREQ